jgi:fructose-1,6-bisphosphatase I
MYEVNPLALLIEQAGGKAVDGCRRVLEVVPESLHQRSPFVCGSPEDIDDFLEYVANDPVSEASVSE